MERHGSETYFVIGEGLLTQGVDEEPESVQRLAQIVTGRGQEA